MKIATAEQMRQCDRLTIEDYGIPGLLLMENAGLGTVTAMARHFGPLAGRKVLVAVGPGNNGGDGLVIARLLLEGGALPQVFSLVEPERIVGDAAANLVRLRQLPIPFDCCLDADGLTRLRQAVAESDLLVDALFGTGLKREVSGLFAETIRALNDAKKNGILVIAVDLPSGLDADRGIPLGVAVRADLTCSYGLAKFATAQAPGREYVGHLEIIDIGIPAEVVQGLGVQAELLSSELLAPLVPKRGDLSHKGSFGHLLVVAGGCGKGGAAVLCGRGALRSGLGLCTLAAPRALNSLLQNALPEAMTLPLSFSQQHFSDADLDQLLEAAGRRDAVALGPGLGTSEETGQLVARLYQSLPMPMVVDADGLNLLAQNSKLLGLAAGPRLLTPHPGEMARLTGLTVATIQENRPAVALDFARRHRVFLLLKGAATVIAAPDGRLAFNPSGNPGMATGGMGDVLTGLVGGLLAQGLPPFDAACLAAYVHGQAADRLVAAGKPFGYLAGEVADEIPAAFCSLLMPLGISRERVESRAASPINS